MNMKFKPYASSCQWMIEIHFHPGTVELFNNTSLTGAGTIGKIYYQAGSKNQIRWKLIAWKTLNVVFVDSAECHVWSDQHLILIPGLQTHQDLFKSCQQVAVAYRKR